ncbi:MAG: hypothetical protein R3B07_08995 [Polyangiaceae bacterium]
MRPILHSDAYFCDGGNVQRCALNGLTWNLADYCKPGESCVDGEPNCRPPTTQYCVPNEWSCYSNLLRKCNATGTGFSQTQSCGSGYVCTNAMCVPVVCSPGTTYCDGNAARACSADGQSSVLLDVCSPDENCSFGSCRAKTCTPGHTVCNGNYQVTCSADGGGYNSQTYCPSSGKVCLDGYCQTVFCTPLQRLCADSSTAQVCRADGSAWDSEPCGNGRHCISGKCVDNPCTAGAVGCSGNVVSTCKADGTGWQPSGPDCAATGQTCIVGECRDLVCTPGTAFCQEGDVYDCPNGNGARLYNRCDKDLHCKDGYYGVDCYFDVCPQGMATCDGNRATTCKSDGSGYEPGGTTCAQYCVAGACSTSYFQEAFDTTLAQWTSTNPDVQASLVNVTTAESSALSLLLTRTGTTTGAALETSFAEHRPSAISWWAQVGTASTDAATIRFDDTASTALVTQGFFANGSGLKNGTTLSGAAPYLADTWYHLELRNIDWLDRTFDYYVDGSLRATQIRMPSGKYGIGSISLDCSGTQTTCRFDQIEFTP